MSEQAIRVENPDEAFKELLTRVRDYLKPFGFRKRAKNFIWTNDELAHILNFQVTQWKTKQDPVNFTVNVRLIIRDLVEVPASGQIPLGFWHAHERIGFLVGAERRDRWLEIGSRDDVEPVFNELRERFEQHVFPALDRARDATGFIQFHPVRGGKHSDMSNEAKTWLQSKLPDLDEALKLKLGVPHMVYSVIR